MTPGFPGIGLSQVFVVVKGSKWTNLCLKLQTLMVAKFCLVNHVCLKFILLAIQNNRRFKSSVGRIGTSAKWGHAFDLFRPRSITVRPNKRLSINDPNLDSGLKARTCSHRHFDTFHGFYIFLCPFQLRKYNLITLYSIRIKLLPYFSFQFLCRTKFWSNPFLLLLRPNLMSV